MKLFVTDYDGTLYIDELSLTINRKKLLELHNLGFIIVISTGRCFKSIKNQLQKYNLYYDYLHCADGSIIYDKNDNLIKFYEMEHNIVKEILSLKEKAIIEEVQISYPKEYKDTYNKKDKIAGINLVIKSILVDKNFVNNFLALKNKYSDYNFLFYDHGDYAYLCVKKQLINKSYAINFMKDLLSIKENDIYVIGDSYNDLEMIEEHHGCSIIGNDDINKKSKKCYHQVYEYINDIKEDLSIKN